MICGQVHAPMAWEGWGEARRLLLQSVERADDHGIEDVERDLKEGRAQLWVYLRHGVRLAGVTKLVRVNDGAQCFIWHLAGEWKGFADPLLAEVEAFARANGCGSIEGNMRPGFERRLKGWTKASVVMRKDLGGVEDEKQDAEH